MYRRHLALMYLYAWGVPNGKGTGMKHEQVQIGGTYVAKVSGRITFVRIDSENPHGGWDATGVTTRRKVRIKSAQRLRREVAPGELARVPPQEGDQPPGEDGPSQRGPDKCSIDGCDEAPTMTYLGNLLCRAHWDLQSEQRTEEEESNESEGDACRPEEETTNEENDEMSKKKNPSKKPSGRSNSRKIAKAEKAAKAVKPEKGPKRVSALDAAAQVLKASGKPMGSKELIEKMAAKGLWTSPGGKTPHATLYAAMMREARDKGKAARFTKVDRGMFAYNG
jgi:hypothetical protein